MPPWVKPALAGGVGVLLLAGGLVGGILADRPEQTPSPSASPSPAFPLDTPLMVDDLVRGESSESTGPGPANQRIVQADYTDGENTVVFILSWPEPDVAEFVANAGIEIDAQTPSPTGGSRYCGVSEDTGESACGEVIDEVGVLLVSVTEQSETAVAETLDRFKEAIGQ